MPYPVDLRLSPHHLGPMHGRQGGEVQGPGYIVGFNLAGYGGQPTAGQARLTAVQQWTLHRAARLKVLLLHLLLSRKAFLRL